MKRVAVYATTGRVGGIDRDARGTRRRRPEACGVCHTDLHYREGGIGDEFPFLLGHEAAGVTDVAPIAGFGAPLLDVFGRGGALKSSWYGDCLPSRDFPALIDPRRVRVRPLTKVTR